ncbi:MAG: hypothetical protein LBQ58_01670 [Synergistaceae bacterium]|jgi:hypothetical protein|nr:hypothetical protein [Synergistaceae bacterium]
MKDREFFAALLELDNASQDGAFAVDSQYGTNYDMRAALAAAIEKGSPLTPAEFERFKFAQHAVI